MRTIDLHNHTTFSYDGTNTPEEIIENAIAHSIDVIGISDHQFSIGGDLSEYIGRIRACGEKYRDKIRVLCGLEIGTRPAPEDLNIRDTDVLDYVLFESLDDERAMDFKDFLAWQRNFHCKKGFAHTDIFRLGERYGLDMLALMRAEGLFWELNVSGNYSYYYDFLTNDKKRAAVQKSGVTVSIGSDTHWTEEYRFRQLRRANELILGLGNPVLF
ncbi:MAG: PHP domain-containing protein [Clostridiales bacterium]|nr:PHP domain-containing protein [Clostridiales bacterium]